MRPVFDGHHDALTSATAAGLAAGRADGHFDLPRAREAGAAGSMFAVFTPNAGSDVVEFTPLAGGGYEAPYPPPVPHAEAAAHASRTAGRLLALERAGELRVARRAADLDAAAAGGPLAAVLHLEGAEAIDPDLEALDLWHAAGLRSLGPVWSRANAFGHGVPFRLPASPDIGPGLTDAGRALVRRCAELGILVDVSHLNAAGFDDVARLDAGPLVASHSGVHALCPASRNLTDAQLDAVGRSGGLVGVVFAVAFLRRDGRPDADDTPLGAIVEHVRHVADRIGVDHVAFGSDFDGALVPRELGDVTGLPRLLAALEDAGFTRDEVDRIAWSNWRRVLATAWHEA